MYIIEGFVRQNYNNRFFTELIRQIVSYYGMRTIFNAKICMEFQFTKPNIVNSKYYIANDVKRLNKLNK